MYQNLQEQKLAIYGGSNIRSIYDECCLVFSKIIINQYFPHSALGEATAQTTTLHCLVI